MSRSNATPSLANFDSTEHSDFSIGETIRRHIAVIVGCAVLCVLASYIYLRFQRPVFEATAVVRIDSGRANSLGLGDLFSGASSEQNDTTHTEIAILKSDAVAIETLNSLTEDQFQQFAHRPKNSSPIPDDAESLPSADEALISKVQVNTSVRQEEGTQLLDVRFRDGNPVVAAMMANRLIDAYSLQSFKSRGKSVTQLRTYLLAEMNDLHEKLGVSQAKLAAFQQRNQILGPSDEKNTITDRLVSLNTKLTDAQAVRIAVEAQLKAARAGDAAALATLFPNPRLARLQADEGNAESDAAEMATKFGVNYPPLALKRKQIEALKTQIADSVESVKAQIKQQYDAAYNNEVMLHNQYNEQTKLAYGLNRSQAEYATLQAEVTSSRELSEMLQRKLQQAEVDTQVSSISTVRVDVARAPLTPVEPKRTLILAAGLFIGLFSGAIVAFLFETSSDQLRSAIGVQQILGVHSLARIPVESAQDDGPLTALKNPQSAPAEAYRALRNFVMTSSTSEANTVLFVSATPGEGLPNVVANVALSLAQTGATVLLLDADLRQPTLHSIFGVKNTSGLSEFLSGSDLPVTTPVGSVTSLSLVTAGQSISFPSEALASRRLKTALQAWKTSYDYILWQTSPLLSVSDGMPLAEQSDTTILVMKYGASRSAEMHAARKLLLQSNARITGFVMFDVPKSTGTFTG